MSSPALAYVARIKAFCAVALGIVSPAVAPSWLSPVSRMMHSIWSLSSSAALRVLRVIAATPLFNVSSVYPVVSPSH